MHSRPSSQTWRVSNTVLVRHGSFSLDNVHVKEDMAIIPALVEGTDHGDGSAMVMEPVSNSSIINPTNEKKCQGDGEDICFPELRHGLHSSLSRLQMRPPTTLVSASPLLPGEGSRTSAGGQRPQYRYNSSVLQNHMKQPKPSESQTPHRQTSSRGHPQPDSERVGTSCSARSPFPHDQAKTREQQGPLSYSRASGNSRLHHEHQSHTPAPPSRLAASSSRLGGDGYRNDEQNNDVEAIRQEAALISPNMPRFLPMTAKQALQNLQQSVRALITSRGSIDMGSIPSLLLTTYNIVCKQTFNDKNATVLSQQAEYAQQPRSLFDTLAHAGEDTTIATELRDLQRELLLTKKHYHVAIQQIDIFKHRINEHIGEIHRLEKLLDVANAVELQLRSEIGSQQLTMQRKDIELSEVKTNIVTLHASMHDVANGDHSRISERTADLRKELVSLYEQLKQSDEMSKSFEREVANLQGELRRADERYEESQKELADTQEKLVAKEDELYAVKVSSMDQGKKMKVLQDNIEDLLVVQGDTMVQAKMIEEDVLWGVYKDQLVTQKRNKKQDGLIIPSHIKVLRGFGVVESIPAWLRAEGKIKPKFLNRGDTMHVALQALTDLSLPASLTSNTKALLMATHKPPGAPGPGSFASTRAQRDDAILSGIGGMISVPVGRGASIAGGGGGLPLGGGGGYRGSFAGASVGSASGMLGGGNTSSSAFDNGLQEIASRLPFSDAFKMWLSRSGTDILNNKQGTELAYGFHHSLERWGDEPDLVLFTSVLRGDVPPELHYYVYRSLDEMLNLFITADEALNNGEQRRAIPITTVSRVMNKLITRPCSFATEADAKHLLFLLTIDFNIPYIPYRSLFDYDEDGDRNFFLQEVFSLIVSRALEYYNVIQDMVEQLGRDALAKQRMVEEEAVAARLAMGGCTEEETEEHGTVAQEGEEHTHEYSEDDDDHQPEDEHTLPGNGFPTRPVAKDIAAVEVSLRQLGTLWVQEDPLKADEMSDLLNLLRFTMIAIENAASAKKKAEEEAALAATQKRRYVPSLPPRRTTISSGHAAQPPVEATPTEAPPPRDLFTVQAIVNALRQLVVTRSSHRCHLETSPESASAALEPLREAARDSGSAAEGVSPARSYDGRSLNSPLDGVTTPVGFGDTLTTGESASYEGGLGRNKMNNVSHSFDVGSDSNSESKAFRVDVHTLLPPEPIAPRFELRRAVENCHVPNSRINSGLRSNNDGLLTSPNPRERTGSVASQSLAGGGGFGVPQSRTALQAMAKRSQTQLPPFFKMRMMRH